MKYLILIGLIYGIYKISDMKKTISAQQNGKIDQEEDSGFTDYEEVE